MKRIFEQLVKRPLNALASSAELLNKRINLRQKIDGMVSRWIYFTNRSEKTEKNDLPSIINPSEQVDNSSFSDAEKVNPIFNRDEESGKSVEKVSLEYDKRAESEKKKASENITNMDKNLKDNKLKLVRYNILFTKRDYEHIFDEIEVFVSKNIAETDFTAWKIAEFIQYLSEKKMQVPEKWLKKNYPPPEFREGSTLKGIPDEDKKYLRVFHQVSERYTKEKFEFEEDQIDVLREIRDQIRDIK